MIPHIWDFIVRMLPGGILALLVYCVLLPVRRRRMLRVGQTSPLHREIIFLLFFLFCGGMALITLTPRWFHWLTVLHVGTNEPFFQIGTFNLIPFRTFALDSWSIMILLGNVIMFFPIGFFYALLWRKNSWQRILLVGFLTTFCIEGIQLFVGRTFDIDDILLNTIGILLGGLFCQLLQRMIPTLHTFQVQNT